MPNYSESPSTVLGLLSNAVRNSIIKRFVESLLGLLSSKTKSSGRTFKPLLGIVSSVNRIISSLKTLSSSIGHKLSPSASHATGGTPVGTRLFYSLGGSPEKWEKETARIKITLSDLISGRARLAEIIISNPKNTRDSTYTIFKRIKLVDFVTNQIIFLGRVVTSNSGWDSDYGLVLNISSYDYMYEFIARFCTTNFNTPIKRADMIGQLVTDYSTSGTVAKIISATSTDLIMRDYSTSSKKVSQVMEEIAIEDSPGSDVGCDYRVDDSDTPIFSYFIRGANPAGGAAVNGLTISLTDTAGNQVKRMLSDYNFSFQPKDIITKVICRGEDSNGNKLEASAIAAGLESTYGIRTEYIDIVYGATTQDYLDTRAAELLKVYGKTIKRGACSIVGFPVYKIGNIYYTVRAGDLVHIHNTLQSVNQDYLVVGIKYEEPPVITKFELLDISDYGRELPVWLPKPALSAADIGDLKTPLVSSTDRYIFMYIPGSLSTGANYVAIPIPLNSVCDNVVISVTIAPVGASIIVDINLAGTTIFTTQSNRPTILAGQTSGTSGTPNITSFSKGQILSVDIDQVGSGTAGTNLMIDVVCHVAVTSPTSGWGISQDPLILDTLTVKTALTIPVESS